MYLDFYGLSEKPFSQTPDPRFLYWNDAYRETLASLSYGVRERKGFIAMLGEAGTGKTTLLRKLLDDLGDDIVSVFLFNPNATFEEILEYTLSELGIPAPAGRKLAMLQRLNEFLLAAYAEGRNTILVIDEAQDLESDVLESLRLLSNLETADDKILQIVLSGQPELAEKLADPGLRQLKQRISVRCRLEPLQYEELPSYVGARLSVAGGSPELFDPETFPAIWEFTTGIPRIINTVCDNALLLGYALGKRTLDLGVVEEVLADLRKIDVDGWYPTLPPPEPEPAAASSPASLPESPAPPPAEPAREEPAPRAARAVAPPRERSSSVAWLVAAVVVGALLLVVGAWLGRVRSDALVRPAAVPLDPAPAEREARDTIERETAPEAPVRDAAALPPTGPAAADVAPAATVPETVPAAEPLPPPPEAAEAPTAVPDSLAEVADPDPAAAPAADLPFRADPALAAPDAAPSAEGAAPADARLPHDGAGASAGAIGADPLDVPAGADEGDETAAVGGGSADETAEESPTVRAGSPAGPAGERVALVAVPEGAAVATEGRSGPTIPVAPGDTLLDLVAKRYGSSNMTTLDMLLAVNPDVRSPDLIIAGTGLVFPEPGPDSRILADGSGYSVLAMTTPTLSRALAVQTSLEERFARPVSLERVAGRGEQSVFRVSVRGVARRADAAEIAAGLGPILEDPAP